MPTSNSDERAAFVDVSDHAIVRWLERTDALDIAGLRSALARICEQHAILDMPTFNFYAGGLQFVVRNYCLVTIAPTDGPALSYAGANEQMFPGHTRRILTTKQEQEYQRDKKAKKRRKSGGYR